MKTFEQFQATGTDAEVTDMMRENAMGLDIVGARVYDAGCHILKLQSGWYLCIERSEYFATDADLPALERKLYDDWYLHEVSRG